MNMKRMFSLPLFLALFLVCHGNALAQPASGAKPIIVVFDVQPLGVERITAEVASQLLRQELAATGAFQVMDKGEMEKKLGPGYQCFYVPCASDSGKRLGASRAVIGTLSRLGEKFFLDVKVVDAERAEVVNTGQMTSATVEDLDIVTKRLAMAIAQGKRPEQTITVETVTAKEAEAPRRREAYNTGGIMIGALFPVSDSFGGVDNLQVIDLVYLYELDWAMVEFRPGIMWGYKEEDDGNYSALDFRINLGGFYVPLKGNFSPYIGGGGGLHFIGVERPKKGSAGDTAFGIHVGGGLIAFRTSNLHLIADVRYEHVFSPLDGYGARGVSLMLGLTYRAKTCCLF